MTEISQKIHEAVAQCHIEGLGVVPSHNINASNNFGQAEQTVTNVLSKNNLESLAKTAASISASDYYQTPARQYGQCISKSINK